MIEEFYVITDFLHNHGWSSSDGGVTPNCDEDRNAGLYGYFTKQGTHAFDIILGPDGKVSIMLPDGPPIPSSNSHDYIKTLELCDPNFFNKLLELVS